MGREHPTVVVHPNQNRRDERAKRARDMKNRDIPDMLRASPRARHGIHKADLIVDPAPFKETPQNLPSIFPSPEMKIRVQCADTLSAASKISEKPFATSKRSTASTSTPKSRPQVSNATILNMASQLRPGGGFLDGANSQEEFLCARTTLYPSLWDSFYRLPEISGIFTPDVLVFRDHLPEANELLKRDRFFVDVISAGMFKFADARAEGCSCGVSYCDRHRELVVKKMKAVLRIAQMKGVQRLVLGAWGCGGGAGNPVGEMAKLWRKVIAGGPRQRRPNLERWQGIQEIVFAIPDRTMVREFESAFADVLAPPEDSPSSASEEDLSDDQQVSESEMTPNNINEQRPDESAEISLLLSRIAEAEMQLETVANQPRARARLRNSLAILQRELAEGLSAKASRDDEDIASAAAENEGADGFIAGGNGYDGTDAGAEAAAAYDDEDAVASGGFYHFDEDDVASDSSALSSGTASEIYEFRAPQPAAAAGGSLLHAPQKLSSHRPSFAAVGARRSSMLEPGRRGIGEETTTTQTFTSSPRFDPESGWFSGSMDQLSTLLRGGVVDGVSLNGDVAVDDGEEDQENADRGLRGDEIVGGGAETNDFGGIEAVPANRKASLASPASPEVVRPLSSKAGAPDDTRGGGAGGFGIDEDTLRSYLRRYEGTDGGSD